MDISSIKNMFISNIPEFNRTTHLNFLKNNSKVIIGSLFFGAIALLTSYFLYRSSRSLNPAASPNDSRITSIARTALTPQNAPLFDMVFWKEKLYVYGTGSISNGDTPITTKEGDSFNLTPDDVMIQVYVHSAPNQNPSDYSLFPTNLNGCELILPLKLFTETHENYVEFRFDGVLITANFHRSGIESMLNIAERTNLPYFVGKTPANWTSFSNAFEKFRLSVDSENFTLDAEIERLELKEGRFVKSQEQTVPGLFRKKPPELYSRENIELLKDATTQSFWLPITGLVAADLHLVEIIRRGLVLYIIFPTSWGVERCCTLELESGVNYQDLCFADPKNSGQLQIGISQTSSSSLADLD